MNIQYTLVPDFNERKFNNQRKAIRYIRTDILTAFYKTNILNELGFKKFRRIAGARLIDISSKGALISANGNLDVNDKIVLGLKFETGRIFKLKASIVRKYATNKKLDIKIKKMISLKTGLTEKSSVNILVINKKNISNYDYGVKFDFNDELGNYLFETQKQLIFGSKY